MDVGLWVVLSACTVPCVFPKETRACCSRCCARCQRKTATPPGEVDPDHAKKLADVGVNVEAGAAAQAKNKRRLITAARVALVIVAGYLYTLAVLGILFGTMSASFAYAPEDANACVVNCTDSHCCDYSQTTVPYKNVYFESEGATLNGWYMESDVSSGGIPTPLVPILYSHGSGKNIAVRYRVERYQFLLTLGVKLFVYDYPGYGESTGDPSESSVKASSKAAYQVLVGEAGVTNKTNIVLLGRSLGGGVTVNLATQADIQSQGMILQSTFTSLAAAVGGLPGYFPVTGWFVTAVFTERFDSKEVIHKYTGCLLDAHSKDDEWVDFDDGKELYDAATNVPASCKQFVEIPNAKHDDPLTADEKAAMTSWVNARRAAMV